MDEGSNEEGGVSQPVARYPLEGRRWLRLAALTASCTICAGVLLGAAQWVPILADAGVGGSRCLGGSAGTCDEQLVFLAGAFSAAQCATMFAVVIVGYLFDRFGANFSGTVGALIVCLGLLILQIPLLGAQCGYDSQTSGFLVWGLILIDAGTNLNNYSLYGLLYHFPEYQTLVAGLQLVSCAATALFPMFAVVVQDWTGLPLHFVFSVWLVLAVLASGACRLLAPTVEEFDEQAQKVLGFPPPRADKASFLSLLKDANDVLRCNCIRHLCFALSAGAVLNLTTAFPTLSSDYGSLLFHSKEAGEELSQLYSLSFGLGGTLLTPAVSYISDNLRHATQLLVALLASLLIVAAFSIATPTWLALGVTSISISMSSALQSTLLMKYALAFAAASRFGLVLGLLITYTSIGTMVLMTGTFTWISSLPEGSQEHLVAPLQGASWLAAASFFAWGAHYFYVGLPAVAVILPKDEEHMAAPFGCTSLSELAIKFGLQGRDEAIKMLSDPESLKSLAPRKIEEAASAEAPTSEEKPGVPDIWAPPQATLGDEASWMFGFSLSWILAPCCVSRAKPQDDGYREPLLLPSESGDPAGREALFKEASPRE